MDVFCTKFHPAFLIILVFISAGCRKDRDTSSPQVRVSTPGIGPTIQLPDTFVVQVDVSDDRALERLVIDVLNADGSPVATPASFTLSGNNASVLHAFIISDEQLRSDEYTIQARAFDGSNEGRGFLSITLNEIPLRLRAVFIAPAFSNTSSTIQKLDSAWQLSDLITVQDLNGMAVDSYTQHLMIAGSQFQPFQALPTTATSNTWQYAGPGNDAPEQFTALSVDPSNGLTYFATRDGSIRGSTGNGAQVFTAQSLSGYRTQVIVALDGRVITWQHAIVGPEQQVVSYTVAGSVLEILPVPFERIQLFRRISDRLILFANENGNGVVKDLNITEAGSPTRYLFTEGTIRAAVQLDADNYIVAFQDRIFRYTYSTNLRQQLTTGMVAEDMAYDRATGLLFVAEGSTVHAVDPNSGVVVNSISAGMAVAHLGILNNR